MNNYLILEASNSKFKYTHLIKRNVGKNGYKKIISLGRSDELAKKNDDYLKIFRVVIKTINNKLSPEKIKSILLSKLVSKNEKTKVSCKGVEVIYSIIRYLNLFSLLPKTKHKNLEAIFEYQIASKILNDNSILQRFKEREKYHSLIDSQKDTFYSFLDVLANNQESILRGLNNRITKETNRNIELIFYDSSTIYFESFVREGIRVPGYSKDGKFKEDQVVIGMATDENGIPIFFKLFKGNTADCNTLIPFIIEMRNSYNLTKVTIIADKGMSINKNIRFLEANGIDFIISYRLKTSSKEFKNFALDPVGFKQLNEKIRYKEYTYNSHWKGKRVNENIRRRIITHNSSKAKKDYEDRENLINNFKKAQDKNGIVKAEKITKMKKFRFFKKIGNMEFVLDYEKVLEDKKFDGFYVYETSRTDLKPDHIISAYHKQWQIEENFRTLKGALKVRPIYVWSDKHIYGHFILCFIALVVLKYAIYLVNKYYKENGEVNKMTNDKFIKAINSSLITKHYFHNELQKTTDSEWEGDEENILVFNDIKEAIQSGMQN